MWLAFSIGACLSAALGIIFTKQSLKRTDFTIVSAIKISVILLFTWYTVFTAKSQSLIASAIEFSVLHIILVGLLLSGAVICYHASLKHTDVMRATATEEIGSVLILLSGIFVFNQNGNAVLRWIGIILITVGIYIMLSSKGKGQKTKWLVPGVASAVLTCIAVIISKKHLSNVNSFVALSLIMTVALLVCLISVFIRGITSGIGRVPAGEILFSIVSAVCYCLAVHFAFKALSFGHDSVSVAIMQMSSIVAILLSCLFFKQKLSWRTACGLLLIVCGVMTLVFLVGVYKF